MLFTRVSFGLRLREREAVNGPVSVVCEDLRTQGHTGCSLMLTEDLQGHPVTYLNPVRPAPGLLLGWDQH